MPSRKTYNGLPSKDPLAYDEAMRRLIPNLMVFSVFLFGVKNKRLGLVLLTLGLAVLVYVIFHIGISARTFLESIV